MRISDWSSDVCSSDLASAALAAKPAPRTRPARAAARTSRMSVNRWGSASVPPSLRSSSGPQQASAITIPLHQRVAAQVDGVAVDGQQAFGRPQQISRSEEHTSELQSLMRISYAVFCLKHKTETQLN